MPVQQQQLRLTARAEPATITACVHIIYINRRPILTDSLHLQLPSPTSAPQQRRHAVDEAMVHSDADGAARLRRLPPIFPLRVGP